MAKRRQGARRVRKLSLPRFSLPRIPMPRLALNFWGRRAVRLDGTLW